ncbi:hypothetical protein FUA48_16215 [Flavobacterium alkalisoli]|uniref:Uncharacterized protein n=1 Tax=Flavobacterium alkalisoli TaxID=2602769 RepID=A0A5B9FVV9_9FLAO|nr:hypothetical protein [Flavobacterium alkalisoli]QEE51065.1 hypothetical protein FUA48_16215 [Flavobacterium alkalisoli]
MTANYIYNPEKRHLILTTPSGKPVLSIAGAIAQRMYDRINQQKRQPMEMNADQLERKIAKLNEWLLANPEGTHDYRLNKQSRDYHVNKLMDLENSGLRKIKV